MRQFPQEEMVLVFEGDYTVLPFHGRVDVVVTWEHDKEIVYRQNVKKGWPTVAFSGSIWVHNCAKGSVTCGWGRAESNVWEVVI